MSGSKGGSQNTTQSTAPWGPSQQFILNGLDNASMLFQDQSGNSSFYTPRNANQQQGDTSALNYASGKLPGMIDPYQNWSQTMLGRPGANDNPFGINPAIQQNMNLFSANSGATGQGIDANPYNINTAIQHGLQDPSANNNPFGIGSAIQQGLQAPNVGANPYLEQFAQAATRPLQQQLDLQTNPGIRSAFGMAQPGGGSRQGIAEGVAQGMTNQAIGDARANIFSNAYGQGLNQQTNALSAANQAYGTDIARQQGALGSATQNYGIGADRQNAALGYANQAYGQGLDAQGRALALYPQALQAGLMPSQIYGAVGGTQQADQNAAQTDPWKRLGAYQDAVSGFPTGTRTSMQGGTSGSNSLLTGLGAAGTGAGIASALGMSGGGATALTSLAGLLGLFSDERLKKGVEKIADLGPVDLYQWKWNDKASRLGLDGSGIGLLAGDVEKAFPEHVGERDGYKVVNYTGVFRALSGAK